MSHPDASPLRAVTSFLLRGTAQLTADLLQRQPGRTAHDGPARAEPVATAASLPEHPVDVIVIGAGMVGTCIALTLAERGKRVALFEKGQVAGEASSRAFGWVTDLFEDPQSLGLTTRSKRLWAGLNERIGADTGFRRVPTLFLCATAEQVEAARQWISQAETAGAHPRLLSTHELKARLGDEAARWAGAMQLDGEGTIDARHATAPIARRAQALGVHIAAPCAVRTLALEGGQVVGVHTERGLCRAPQVVLAGGVWSTLLARQLGVAIPTAPMFLSNQALRLPAGAGPIESRFTPKIDWWLGEDGLCRIGHPMMTVPVTPTLLGMAPAYLPLIAAMGHEVKMKLRWGRGLNMLQRPAPWGPQDRSPFERCRVLSPEPDTAGLDEVLALFRDHHPDCTLATVADRWAGAVALTPDARPCIGAAPGVPGLYLAVGFGAGLTQGPAAAESLVQLMLGEPTTVDLQPFDPARFS